MILENLRWDFVECKPLHPIDSKMEFLFHEAMADLSSESRAALAIAIDDAFSNHEDPEAGREAVMRILRACLPRE
ncbi:hypothetical protein MRB56_14190 [Halomonas cupida]|uniref:hypothetical protein n=1 Tax=Halomonas cupida TaxID=44933 RepID=UPI0039B5482C